MAPLRRGGRRLSSGSVPPPSDSEKIDCAQSFDCVFSTLDLMSVPGSFPGLSLTVGDSGVNLFSYFDPSDFVNVAKYYSGLGFCQLAVKGSELANWAVPSNPATQWLSYLSAMGAAQDFLNIFASLPVQPDEYYLVGAYATGVPGLVDVPGFPGPVQVAGAINFCIGDYIFGYNGLEVTFKLGSLPLYGTMALTSTAYSYRKKLSSDDLGVPNVYWSPSGAKTLAISGDILTQADISVDLGFEGSVAVSVNAGNTMLINTDPRGDGVGTTPDFQALLDMAAGPSIELLDGKLSIDLSAMASSEITLLTSYISDSNYQFALRMVGFFSITDFLNTIPGMPGAVSKYMGSMYPSTYGSMNAYIDQKEWGIMMDFTGNYGSIYSAPAGAAAKYSSKFKVLGDVFTQILQYVGGFDATLSGGFSISGPMTGNGLPIKASFWTGTPVGKATLGVYFCENNGDCPGGSSCTLGICSSFSCPAGTAPQGLLCYPPCRSGYTNVLGVCWENCPSGWTDGGATCISPGNCPSGQENVAGICYDRCRDGYGGVGSVCWSRCDDGFTDIGALCTRGAKTRGKGCCCISYISCRGFIKCRTKKSCCDNCDDGFSDTGCTCFQPAVTRAKSSYVRPPGGSPFTITWKASYVIAPQIPMFKIPGTTL